MDGLMELFHRLWIEDEILISLIRAGLMENPELRYQEPREEEEY